jgi:uncharacterized membrane protein YcaP (DUF421 family)
MEHIFFNGWDGLLRVPLIGVLAYVGLLIILRVSGNRTLSKMNAYDFIVTIAIGSTLASTMVSKGVALAEGMLALALLVALQYAVTWTSVRVNWIRRAVTGEPVLLLFQGRMLHDAMRRSRVTTDELRVAVRAAGIRNVEDAEAVVLETDASFSVIEKGGTTPASSLADVPLRDDRGSA